MILEAKGNEIETYSIRRKEDYNLKDLIDILKKKENKLIKLFSDLEEISMKDPEIFNELVSNRKDKNKEQKLNIQKMKEKYCKNFKVIF